MVENVDRYDITWDDETVIIEWTDVLGRGEVYMLPREDAIRFRDDLSLVLARQAGPTSE